MLTGPATGGALAKPKPRRSERVLGLKWHRIAGASGAGADRRYVVLGKQHGNTVVVVDEHTGSRREVVFRAGCTGRALHQPWLAFECYNGPPGAPGHIDLYSLTAGTWTAVELSPPLSSWEDSCLSVQA